MPIMGVESKMKRIVRSFGAVDWDSMFMRQGPPLPHELPCRVSVFIDKKEGWRGGEILEQREPSEDDEDDEEDEEDETLWNIKYDDLDVGILSFPDRGVLIHGDNITCTGPINEFSKLRCKVAVKMSDDPTDSFSIGTLLGTDVNGKKAHVHVDDEAHWFNVGDVYELQLAGSVDVKQISPPSASQKRPMQQIKTKKQKKEKTTADGVFDPPKGRKSSYLFFCEAVREEVKADHPELTMCQQQQEIGKLWKALSEDDKKVYTDKAAADKTRYLQEKEIFDQSSGSASAKSAGILSVPYTFSSKFSIFMFCPPHLDIRSMP